MGDFLSAAISIGFHGLALAMVLYLISVGLSVTMGLMGFVNLAHGAFAMAGGYVMTTLMNRAGVPFPLALLAAVAVVVAASFVLERLLYRRLYGGDELDQVLLTIGLIFMTVGAATYFWGPVAQPMRPPAALSGQIELGGRDFPTYRTFLIVCGAVLVTSRLFAITFALGSGLAALGGALGAEMLSIGPNYAFENLAYFLIVVAVGGLGSIRGPFIAALLVGVADTAFKYIAPELGAFFIYALTMMLLLWRPRGLFGHA